MKIHVCLNFKTVASNDLTLLDNFNVSTEGVTAVPELINTFMQGQGVQPVDNNIITQVVKTIVQQGLRGAKPEYAFDSLPEDYALSFTIPEFLPGYKYAVDFKNNTLSVIFARKPKSSSEYNEDLEFTVIPAVEDFMVKNFELTEDQFKSAVKICHIMYSGNIFKNDKNIGSIYPGSGSFSTMNVTIESKINCVVIKAKPESADLTLQRCVNVKNKINIINHIYNNKSKGAYKTFLMKYAVFPNDDSLHWPKKYPKLGFCVVKRIDSKATPHDDPHPIVYAKGESLSLSIKYLNKYVNYALNGKAKPTDSAEFASIVRPKLDRYLAIIRETVEKIAKNQEYREAKIVEETKDFMKLLSADTGITLTKTSIRNADKLGFDVCTFDEEFNAITIDGEGFNIIKMLQILVNNHDFSSLENLLTKNNGLVIDDTGLLKGIDGNIINKKTRVLDVLLADLSGILDQGYKLDIFDAGGGTIQVYQSDMTSKSEVKQLSNPKSTNKVKVFRRRRYVGPTANNPPGTTAPTAPTTPTQQTTQGNRAANFNIIQQRKAAMMGNPNPGIGRVINSIPVPPAKKKP